MTITKIEAEIDIPEGFDFDRIDITTKDGDYDVYGNETEFHDTHYSVPTIILRKKKPETRWFRAFTRTTLSGVVTVSTCVHVATYSNSRENDEDFIEWITPWIEYSIEPKEKK